MTEKSPAPAAAGDAEGRAEDTPALPPGLTVEKVQRAIRVSYAQAMFGAVYGASTGGMFLIGYALMLGATDVQIGLMSTVPMLCIGVQLVTAVLVERGVSRRRLTVAGATGNVLCWLLIILIPYALATATTNTRIGALVAIITLVTLFAYISGNARGSWVGDLIPASFRGSFFGRLTMYSGIVGAVFAIVEGRFLDVLKHKGIGAFSVLFAFGVLIGLVNVALFLFQADVPVARRDGAGSPREMRDTFRNGPFMSVMGFALLWSLQTIAGPFYSTYMIRDLHIPFLNLGLINSIVIAAMLLSAPAWGRMIDRYGCRAVLTLCSITLGFLQLVWLPVNTAREVYFIIPFANVIAGLCHGGVSVALSTLIYKVTPSAGRAIQFAVYSIIVTLAAAPMPTFGGFLPGLLQRVFPGADLRATFFASIPFLLAAGLVARRIREPESCNTRVLLRALPGHVRDVWQRNVPDIMPFVRGGE